MTLPLKIAGFAFDAIEGRVHHRIAETKTTVEMGIDDVSVGAFDVKEKAPNREGAMIIYRHFVRATSDDDSALFYSISVVTRMMVEIDRSAFPKDGDVIHFLDHALALAMPASAQKLRETCTALGISPVPKMPLFPIRADEHEMAQS